MASRSAMKHVRMSSVATRLTRVAEGLPSDSIANLSWRDSFIQQFTIFGIKQMGFPSGYFDAEFLQGANRALRYAAALVPAVTSLKKATTDEIGHPIDANLLDFCRDAALDMDGEGYRLAWNINRISAASLGKLRITFGLRRRGLHLPKELSLISFDPHCVITRDPNITSRKDALLSSLRHGATLSADVTITCSQSVSILKTEKHDLCTHNKLSAPRVDEHVVAQQTCENATHCLTLEADLIGERFRRYSEDDDRWLHALRFNDALGWTIVDLNQVLQGNYLSAQIPSIREAF